MLWGNISLLSLLLFKLLCPQNAGLQTQMHGLSLAALLQLQPPSVAHGNQLTAVFSLDFDNCFQNKKIK